MFDQSVPPHYPSPMQPPYGILHPNAVSGPGGMMLSPGQGQFYPQHGHLQGPMHHMQGQGDGQMYGLEGMIYNGKLQVHMQLLFSVFD